eukprot:jgi/Chrzof1/10887/Cz05g15300.t1
MAMVTSQWMVSFCLLMAGFVGELAVAEMDMVVLLEQTASSTASSDNGQDSLNPQSSTMTFHMQPVYAEGVPQVVQVLLKQITYIPSNAKTDTERDSTIYPNIPGSNSPAHDAQTRVPVDSTSTTGPADSSTGHASDSSIDGSSTPWPPDVMTHEYNYLKIGIRRLLQHGYPHDLQHTGAHRLLAADPSIPDGLAPQMVNGSAVVLGEWQQSPAVDTVTFVHLHSGSYQLQARALDNSGSPQRASEPYYFTVNADLTAVAPERQAQPDGWQRHMKLIIGLVAGLGGAAVLTMTVIFSMCAIKRRFLRTNNNGSMYSGQQQEWPSWSATDAPDHMPHQAGDVGSRRCRGRRCPQPPTPGHVISYPPGLLPSPAYQQHDQQQQQQQQQQPVVDDDALMKVLAERDQDEAQLHAAVQASLEEAQLMKALRMSQEEAMKQAVQASLTVDATMDDAALQTAVGTAIDSSQRHAQHDLASTAQQQADQQQCCTLQHVQSNPHGIHPCVPCHTDVTVGHDDDKQRKEAVASCSSDAHGRAAAAAEQNPLPDSQAQAQPLAVGSLATCLDHKDMTYEQRVQEAIRRSMKE